jgi:NADP-dependent 3-hydroxy acid dehydrogenase YdfG
MDPASVAAAVVSVADAPSDVLIGELELRPMNPLRSEITGIDRLTML